jgi:hypothetical protein
MTVSVYGGSLLTELGSSEEVEYFFRFVNHFIESQKKNTATFGDRQAVSEIR